MKPLFLTYSNGREPYLTLAHKLSEEVSRLNVGEFRHVRVDGPGNNLDFFVEANSLLYPHLSWALNAGRAVVVLDCDNGVVRGIEALFKADFDIGAVYRYAQLKETGRQDYCSGLIALNALRPALVKRFWIEWTHRIAFYKQCSTEGFPRALKEDGWLESWFSDQGALNQIILPGDNQGNPQVDPYEIVPGKIYTTRGYRILPLDRRLYGALPNDAGDAYIIHYKGKAKEQRLR